METGVLDVLLRGYEGGREGWEAPIYGHGGDWGEARSLLASPPSPEVFQRLVSTCLKEDGSVHEDLVTYVRDNLHRREDWEDLYRCLPQELLQQYDTLGGLVKGVLLDASPRLRGPVMEGVEVCRVLPHYPLEGMGYTCADTWLEPERFQRSFPNLRHVFIHSPWFPGVYLGGQGISKLFVTCKQSAGDPYRTVVW